MYLVKVIGPERTSLLRKPGAKIALKANDRVQTGKDTYAKIKIKGKPEIIENWRLSTSPAVHTKRTCF